MYFSMPPHSFDAPSIVGTILSPLDIIFMLYEFTWEEGTSYLISSYISGGMVIFSVLALFKERVQSRDIELL